MNEQRDTFRMLELMMTPAFSVRDGVVVHVNQAAQQLLIQPGTPIESLLPDVFEEYRAFSSGCLYLTLRLSGIDIGASVSQVSGMDIFLLEQEQTELRALALAAQDLRIPLADAITMTDRLKNEDNQDQLALVNRKLTQLKRLVLNMADASRYTAAATYHFPVVDVGAFVGELLQRMAPQVEAAGFTMQVALPDEKILCQIDEEKLERAIYNLLSNAMKASTPDDLIHVSLYRREKTLYLSVQDRGCGIPDAVLGSVFTRYQRQPGLESGQSGLGLGMVMVRTAAAVHGGTVLVTQPPEGGTRVILSIPIRANIPTDTRSIQMRIDYAGEKDHGLLELADVLPPELYSKQD